MNSDVILDPKNRSKRLIRNSSWGFILNLVAMFLGYLQVPIALNYLGKENYGIWVLLVSVMQWLVFFFFCLGNGLKNKLSESLAKNDRKRSQEYISTTFYSLLALVALILATWLGLLFVFGIGWLKALIRYEGDDFFIVLIITTFYTLMGFLFNVFNQVYHAFQKTYIVNLIRVGFQMLFIVGTLAASLIRPASLLIYSNVYGISLLTCNLIILSQWHFSP